MQDQLGSALNITFSGVVSSLIFGVIGMWMFREGKRLQNYHVLLIGIALMIYPYFTSGPWGDWGVGTALCGLAYYLW